MRMLKALFTTSETKTDEWVPPSMSDTVAVEDSQQPATDLDEIGLPESVSTPNSGEDTAGENGFDN